MHCYLTLLRRDGKRCPADESGMRDHLVTVCLATVQGIRQLTATGCLGGLSPAVLWDPVLYRVAEREIVIRGIEHVGDAAVVQEWLLRPHYAMGWTSTLGHSAPLPVAEIPGWLRGRLMTPPNSDNVTQGPIADPGPRAD